MDALVLNGEFETGWPKGVLSETAVRNYRKAFKGYERLVPGSGHYCLLENHEAVARELGSFLTT